MLNRECPKKKQRFCQLCSAHKKYIAVKNHSRYCKYMNEINKGLHWCDKCAGVLAKRTKTADSIKSKRNREKDAIKRQNLHEDEVPPNKLTNDDKLYACKILWKRCPKMHKIEGYKELVQKIFDGTLENDDRAPPVPTRNKMVSKMLSLTMMRYFNQGGRNNFTNDSGLSSDNSCDGDSIPQDYDKMSRSDTSESLSQWKTDREMETSTEFAEKHSENLANNKDKTTMLKSEDEMEQSPLWLTNKLSEITVSDKDKNAVFTKSSSPPFLVSPGKSVDPLKKSTPVPSPEVATDKFEKNREIFAKTWQLLYDPEFYPMLCKLSLYDWLFLIMKQHIGDAESTFNTIYNSYNESVELINEYHRTNYNDYYYRLNKYLTSVQQNPSDQASLHLPLPRPPMALGGMINPPPVRADLYKEGAPLDSHSGLPPWHLNMLCSSYPGLHLNSINSTYLGASDIRNQGYGKL